MRNAHHNQPREVFGRASNSVNGIVPGGTEHRLLLALRGAGGMSSDQICARFGTHQSAALHRLKDAGLVELPAIGHKGRPIRLTEKGQTLTNADGPLNRRSTLITYCQL